MVLGPVWALQRSTSQSLFHLDDSKTKLAQAPPTASHSSFAQVTQKTNGATSPRKLDTHSQAST